MEMNQFRKGVQESEISDKAIVLNQDEFVERRRQVGHECESIEEVLAESALLDG